LGIAVDDALARSSANAAATAPATIVTVASTHGRHDLRVGAEDGALVDHGEG
jgi:hypothetical protein